MWAFAFWKSCRAPHKRVCVVTKVFRWRVWLADIGRLQAPVTRSNPRPSRATHSNWTETSLTMFHRSDFFSRNPKPSLDDHRRSRSKFSLFFCVTFASITNILILLLHFFSFAGIPLFLLYCAQARAWPGAPSQCACECVCLCLWVSVYWVEKERERKREGGRRRSWMPSFNLAVIHNLTLGSIGWSLTSTKWWQQKKLLKNASPTTATTATATATTAATSARCWDQ